MVAGVGVGQTLPPKGWSKDDDRQQKEGAGHFEPQDAASTAKGTEETADSAADAAPGLICDPPGRQSRSSLLGDGTGGHPAWPGLELKRAGLSMGRKPLPDNTPGNANCDAQGAADDSGSHTVYDGSSGSWRFAPLAAGPGLLSDRNRSKVERFHAAARTLVLRGTPLMEVIVTSRLRELIQQLGEAIHESVIESEQIAGVVQDIRKHGFDVLLMLEATIGLNEVPGKENDTARADEGTGGEVGAFTPNDLHFLRSLRISVEGEPDESATDVK